jgi:hypothetical protein
VGFVAARGHRVHLSVLIIGIASTGWEQPPEILDFLFQLDHLELSPDSQLLELLELSQPLQSFSLLLRNFLLALDLIGYVAGGGEDAEHLSVGVAGTEALYRTSVAVRSCGEWSADSSMPSLRRTPAGRSCWPRRVR